MYFQGRDLLVTHWKVELRVLIVGSQVMVDDTRAFFGWISGHFSVKISLERPVCLLVDGHSSHIDLVVSIFVEPMKSFFTVCLHIQPMSCSH